MVNNYTISLKSFISKERITKKLIISNKEAIKGLNVTGVYNLFYFKETIQFMKKIMPQMKRVAFIAYPQYGTSFSINNFEYVMKQNFPDLGRICLCGKKNTTNDLLDSLSKMDKYTGILFFGWSKDSDTYSSKGYLSARNLRRVISSFVNTPVFCLFDTKNDYASSAGGYYASIDDYEAALSDILHQLINGKNIKDIPFKYTLSAHLYLNYDYLMKFGIDKKLLPQDAIYHNKPLSFIQKYNHSIIVGILSLFIIVFILISRIKASVKAKKLRNKEIELLKKYKERYTKLPIPYLKFELLYNKMKNPEGLLILEINNSLENEFKIKREYIEGKLSSELGYPLSSARMNRFLKSIRPNKPYVTAYNDRTGDRFFRVVIYPNAEDSTYDLFLTDKTDEYKANAANEELRLLLDSILNNISVPLYVKEIGEEIRYSYWNKKAEEFTGIKAEEAIGKTDIEIFGENSGYRFQKDNEYLIKNGGTLCYKDTFLSKNGKTYITNVLKTLVRRKDNSAYILVIRMDITELIKAQKQLELRNHQLSLSFNAGEIAPWTFYVQDNTFIAEIKPLDNLSNNVLTTSRIETLDSVLAMVHPEDREGVKSSLTELLCGRIDKTEIDVRCDFHHDGSKYEWYSVQALVSEYDNENNPIVITGASINISKRKAEEQMLIEAKEKAEESDRMKSAFVSNMSHEIRTPLNAIVGFSRILITEPNLDEASKKQFSDIIESNNQLLLQLVNDVLDLSKIEAGTLDFTYNRTDVNLLLTEITQSMRLKIDLDMIKINYVEGASECIINTDKNRLSQVVYNLMSNAIKFTERGEIVLGYSIRDSFIYFYVKDTGCGIPKDKLSGVFNRFIKLNPFVQGAGLGLSISASIVYKLGGKIWADSEEGVGSTFWFTIPYVTN